MFNEFKKKDKKNYNNEIKIIKKFLFTKDKDNNFINIVNFFQKEEDNFLKNLYNNLNFSKKFNRNLKENLISTLLEIEQYEDKMINKIIKKFIIKIETYDKDLFINYDILLFLQESLIDNLIKEINKSQKILDFSQKIVASKKTDFMISEKYIKYSLKFLLESLEKIKKLNFSIIHFNEIFNIKNNTQLLEPKIIINKDNKDNIPEEKGIFLRNLNFLKYNNIEFKNKF